MPMIESLRQQAHRPEAPSKDITNSGALQGNGAAAMGDQCLDSSSAMSWAAMPPQLGPTGCRPPNAATQLQLRTANGSSHPVQAGCCAFGYADYASPDSRRPEAMHPAPMPTCLLHSAVTPLPGYQPNQSQQGYPQQMGLPLADPRHGRQPAHPAAVSPHCSEGPPTTQPLASHSPSQEPPSALPCSVAVPAFSLQGSLATQPLQPDASPLLPSAATSTPVVLPFAPYGSTASDPLRGLPPLPSPVVPLPAATHISTAANMPQSVNVAGNSFWAMQPTPAPQVMTPPAQPESNGQQQQLSPAGSQQHPAGAGGTANSHVTCTLHTPSPHVMASVARRPPSLPLLPPPVIPPPDLLPLPSPVISAPGLLTQPSPVVSAHGLPTQPSMPSMPPPSGVSAPAQMATWEPEEYPWPSPIAVKPEPVADAATVGGIHQRMQRMSIQAVRIGMMSDAAAGPSCINQQSSVPVSCCLSDIPLAWLSALVLALNPQASTLLLRTCTALRDLVLAHRTVHLRFYLPMAPWDAAACQAKLQLACKYAADIELVLGLARVTYDSDNRSHLAAEFSASASSLLFGAMTAAGRGLTGIQSVVLQKLIMDCVVPSWLIRTCPNMTSLSAEECEFFSLPEASLLTCSQLKHLSISIGCQRIPDKQQWLARWEQQLRALPAVQSLMLNCRSEENSRPELLQRCGSAIGLLLTHLSLILPDLPPGELGLPSAHLFLNVSDLSLPNQRVPDCDMEALLSMPSLRRLTVSAFYLQHSYTHRTCPWVHLSLGMLHTASLARLPLDGMQSIRATLEKDLLYHNHFGCCVYPSSNLEENRRVVASIRPILQWPRMGKACLQLYGLDVTRVPASPGCLAAVLPLLPASNLKMLIVSSVCQGTQVTPELLTALGQYMTATTPSKVSWEHCSFAPHACSLLLPSLPASVNRIEFRGYKTTMLTEAELSAMCSGVCRSGQLNVVIPSAMTGVWEHGWRGRVQAILNSQGQRHVRLRSVPF